MSTPANNAVLLNNALLIVLHANNTSLGTAASSLRLLVRDFGGGQPTEAECVSRLEYLQCKDLVTEVRKPIHTAQRAWKITDFGRQYIDENNL